MHMSAANKRPNMFRTPKAAGMTSDRISPVAANRYRCHHIGESATPQKVHLSSGGLDPVGWTARSREQFGQADHALAFCGVVGPLVMTLLHRVTARLYCVFSLVVRFGNAGNQPSEWGAQYLPLASEPVVSQDQCLRPVCRSHASCCGRVAQGIHSENWIDHRAPTKHIIRIVTFVGTRSGCRTLVGFQGCGFGFYAQPAAALLRTRRSPLRYV
jgi:hypothetical protein